MPTLQPLRLTLHSLPRWRLNWNDDGQLGRSPHFYKANKVIALYVGADTIIADLLVKVLGLQFAGK